MDFTLRTKFEEMSDPHKITYFIIVAALTILLTRIFVMFYNPNPSLFGFEFHHFDYGLALLMWTALLTLFGGEKHQAHLIAFGIAFGWIIDDIWFIRSNLIDPSTQELLIYHSTIIPALVLTGLVLLISWSFWKLAKKS